jgi:SAM-dependent methyltransferase
VSGTIQLDNTTGPNRYPAVFRTAAGAAAAAGLAKGRVLSFGCSTGEEPRTLADTYFPDAGLVLGVDVSASVLAEAERRHGSHPRLRFAPSSADTLRAHGPFAAIFAMSVLCRWPRAQTLDSLAGVYPFESFVDDVSMLDEVLEPGGVLVIFNAHYDLLQTPIGTGYDLVAVPRLTRSGYVTRFDPDGRLSRAGRPLTDCVFLKHESDAPPGARRVLRVLDTNLRHICNLPRALAQPEPGG